MYYAFYKSHLNSLFLLVFPCVANFRYVANFRFLTLIISPLLNFYLPLIFTKYEFYIMNVPSSILTVAPPACLHTRGWTVLLKKNVFMVYVSINVN